MSDYRNPNDPFQRDSPYDLNARTDNAASGWIAGGVLLAIVIGVALGIGHMPNQSNHSTTINNASPPMAQPSDQPSRTSFADADRIPDQGPAEISCPDPAAAITNTAQNETNGRVLQRGRF